MFSIGKNRNSAFIFARALWDFDAIFYLSDFLKLLSKIKLMDSSITDRIEQSFDLQFIKRYLLEI